MVVIMVWFRSGLGVDQSAGQDDLRGRGCVWGAGIAMLHLVEGGAQAGDLLFDVPSSSGNRLRLTAQVVLGGINLAEFVDAVGQQDHAIAKVAVGFPVDGFDLEGEVGLADARGLDVVQTLDIDLAWEVAVMVGR